MIKKCRSADAQQARCLLADSSRRLLHLPRSWKLIYDMYNGDKGGEIDSICLENQGKRIVSMDHSNECKMNARLARADAGHS